MWTLGMSVCNILGARLGTEMALRKGTGSISTALIAVLTMMAADLGYNRFHQ
ncbi:hypothetical protein FB157_14235 [Streptomyces sp. BK340]|nr:hypothetical protein FB157_14235 [Streptomyces sp. BK340]